MIFASVISTHNKTNRPVSTTEKQVNDYRQYYADNNHGSNWYEQIAVFTLDIDITGQFAEPVDEPGCVGDCQSCND
jgi:hypothetical protein